MTNEFIISLIHVMHLYITVGQVIFIGPNQEYIREVNFFFHSHFGIEQNLSDKKGVSG